MKRTLPQVIAIGTALALVALVPSALAQDPCADCPDEEPPRSDAPQPTSNTTPVAPPTDWRGAMPDDLAHIDFIVEPAAIRNYTVDGVRMLDALTFQGTSAGIKAESSGALHSIHMGAASLHVQDGPVGLLSFRSGGAGYVVLQLPDDARIDRTAEGAKVTLGDDRAVLVLRNATWISADSVRVQGFFSYHLREPPAPVAEDAADEEEVADAIANGRVAARIDVPEASPAMAADSARGDAAVQTYDDLDVAITKPTGPATIDRPVAVRIAGDVEGGRTVVANLPAAALAGPEVSVLGFIANDDGTRTEVRLRQADDIRDVLDPTNDDGAYEYWVVRDADGVQVLLSMGHVADTEFEVAGFGELIVQPSVIAGIAIGAVGAAVAGAGMFWPRRR